MHERGFDRDLPREHSKYQIPSAGSKADYFSFSFIHLGSVSYMSNGTNPNPNTGSDREEQQGRFKALCGDRDGPEGAALADRSGDG